MPAVAASVPRLNGNENGRPRLEMPPDVERNGSDNVGTFSMLFSPNAPSLGTPLGNGNSHSVEVELHWEPSSVRSELRAAAALLGHRCCQIAAKWASDQLVGLPDSRRVRTDRHGQNRTDSPLDEEESDRTPPEDDFSLVGVLDEDVQQMTDREWHAKTLFTIGDYWHAAAVLSELPASPADVTSTTLPQPRNNLSSYGVYLRAYALYMAGERRKEQTQMELKGDKKKQSSARNPHLRQLVDELSEAYHASKLDAFGLWIYGMCLSKSKGIETVGQIGTNVISSGPIGHNEVTSTPEPHDVLVESLLQFPTNWSVWLDLAEWIAKASQDIEHTVEQLLQPSLATHYMYHFFCAHLMAHHHQAHEDALVLLERLHEPMGSATTARHDPTNQSLLMQHQPPMKLFSSTYIKTQLGVVQYHLREFQLSQHWLMEAHTEDPCSLDHMDVFSNLLYVQEDKVALSQLAHQAVFVDKYRPETCCIVGNYYSLKHQRQKAISYFTRCLQLDPTYTSAWTLMGHEYVELKQTERAMECYRQAVLISESDYRAWYGLGQTYEFLNMHLYALFYYRKAAQIRPYDPRMWCAVGLCLLALHKIPDAIRAYEKAVAQEDHEGIATQKLATLYRQEGRSEEAARCYLRHLELRYLATHPHVETQSPHETTLDEIVHHVVVEAPEAEALLFLAVYHKKHEEYDTAALFCSRLVEYAGPEKELAKGLLRELRHRAGDRSATSTGSNTNSSGRLNVTSTSQRNSAQMTDSPASIFSNKDMSTAFEFSP